MSFGQVSKSTPKINAVENRGLGIVPLEQRKRQRRNPGRRGNIYTIHYQEGRAVKSELHMEAH